MALSIVILAAGQGKRMRSKLPKVVQRIAGKALLDYVLQTSLALNPSAQPLVIYGHLGTELKNAFASRSVTWVEQTEQLGTGHAIQQALPHLKADDQVLILYGDVPLITVDTLQKLITATPIDAIGLITAINPQPAGLGRIIRDTKNHIIDIVEEKDATAAQREIKEFNSGIYLVSTKNLAQWLPKLSNKNAQKEYYLTDIIKMAVAEKKQIVSVQPFHVEEVLGVNDCEQLAALERFYQKSMAKHFMRQGLTLRDPARFDLRGTLTFGHDVIIDINTVIEGTVTLGNNCIIGPNCILKDAIIGDDVEIKANSIIEQAEIAECCTIGPFARIRPGTELSANVNVGNFVEIKKSRIGKNTKINHLSYIGDSEIGKHVNIGAGTITCNYDGANKHKTKIDDYVFIGSNSQLVAPIHIGEGATIGAGSTITRDALANQLTIARAKQVTVTNWKRPQKKEKET